MIILVILAIGIDLATRKRRTEKLRALGSRIDARPVNEGPSVRQTGSTLLHRPRVERAVRVETMHIRQLAPGDRARFVESWDRVQARFVNGSGSAVADADQLLGDVLSTRGYSLSSFEPGAEDTSVGRPLVLETYRAAHQAALRRTTNGQSSTEDLRKAMIHYRTLLRNSFGGAGGSSASIRRRLQLPHRVRFHLVFIKRSTMKSLNLSVAAPRTVHHQHSGRMLEHGRIAQTFPAGIRTSLTCSRNLVQPKRSLPGYKTTREKRHERSRF